MFQVSGEKKILLILGSFLLEFLISELPLLLDTARFCVFVYFDQGGYVFIFVDVLIRFSSGRISLKCSLLLTAFRN